MVDTELTVSQPLQVRVRLAGLDFNGVLQALEQAVAEACRQLLGTLVRAVERAALAAQPQRYENRGQQTRFVQTAWGWIGVRRTRVRDRHTGRTYNLADALLAWPQYVRRDPRSLQTACELAVTLPYRGACHWWKRLTGQRSSVMNFWRMVQSGGQALVRREQDEVGEIAADQPPPKAVRRVYLEADGVYLRRQKAGRQKPGAGPPQPPGGAARGVRARRTDGGAAGSLLLYAGVSYSRLESTGRNRRNTRDKQVCVEVENLRSFGRQWAWQVFQRFDLARCPNPLFLCDGEEGLLRLGRRHFKQALLQIDRFHVHQQLGRAFGLHTPGYHTALRALCRGKVGRVRSLLALRTRGSRAAACREARTYLARHEARLYTHREWERRTTVRKMGSGVMEKTIETQINRRMKRQGMSWSKAGARRLAKLRVLYRDDDRWARFWNQTGWTPQLAAAPSRGVHSTGRGGG